MMPLSYDVMTPLYFDILMSCYDIINLLYDIINLMMSLPYITTS